LLAHVLEGVVEPVAHLVSNEAIDADPTGLGQPFQPRRDIYSIPEDVVLLGDHVAEINADPELNPLMRRDLCILLGHPPLHLDRTPDGINRTLELGQKAVAGILDYPTPVLCDLGLDQLPEVRLEPFVRPLLIHPHQARITGHIGG
jgi:hypothetical protein